MLGIPITVDLSWFLVFALVLWSLSRGYLPELRPDAPPLHLWVAGTITALLFFGSVLAHELSHSLVARALGVEVVGITLFVFGGVSTLRGDPGDPWTEIKVASAGPLMSLILAAWFFSFFWMAQGAGPESSLAGTALGYLSGANVVLAVFNLVPGFPLDGGRILRAVWWLRTGSAARATRLATRCGEGIGLALVAWGAYRVVRHGDFGGLWMGLIGLFLRSAARTAGQIHEARAVRDRVTVAAELPRDHPGEGPPAGAPPAG